MKIHQQDNLTKDNIVDYIEAIFERRAAESYLGEAVTISQHMLQTAWHAARQGVDSEVTAGALLHDIGHYIAEFPESYLAAGVDNYHEQAGAAVLRPFFPKRVVEIVRWHVHAKRYLCAVDKDYFGTLSAASVQSLKLQGGLLSEEEVAAFEKNPYLTDIVKVRRCDDAGKVKDLATRPFSYYKPLLRELIIS